MQLRRTLIAAIVAAGVLVPALSSAPGIAVAASGKSAKAVAAKAKPKPTPTKAAKPAKPAPTKTAKPAKPAKPVSFSAPGVLTAVNVAGGSVTVAVKGGTTDVRGKTVTFAVTSAAQVRLDEAPATLAELQVGYQVSVTGDRVGSAYRVLKLNASTPEPEPTPTPTPTPTPSTVPTTDPTEPTTEPTA